MEIIKKNIPNFITLSNLCCGLLAIIFAFNNNLYISSYCILLGLFLDFFDGFTARLLEVSGEIGKQLDSLADLVSFGVAPGIILFQLIYWSKYNQLFQGNLEWSFLFPSVIALSLPLFSAIRLARFNIDTKQQDSFIGLPTPASAAIVASLPLIIEHQYPYILHTNLLLSISIILPLLLIINIPLFSLKINNSDRIYSMLNIFRILLVIIGMLLLFNFLFAAIPFIVILYIILSILYNKLKKK